MNPEFRKYTLQDWQELTFTLAMHAASARANPEGGDLDDYIEEVFDDIQEYKRRHPDDDYIGEVRELYRTFFIDPTLLASYRK